MTLDFKKSFGCLGRCCYDILEEKLWLELIFCGMPRTFYGTLFFSKKEGKT
jgi:hypothetical protein